MIIELSQTFASLDRGEWAGFREAIENCLFAHRQGWHIFAPSRKVLEALLASNILTERDEAIARYEILPRIATLVGQSRSASFTLLATVGATDPVIPERRHKVVPLLHLQDGANVLPSRLLVEDGGYDGGFLLELSTQVGDALGYYGPLSLEVVHGGGGGMTRLYERFFDDVRPLLCIVDSDKDHPAARLGQTARQIAAVGGENAYGTVQLAILPVRELDNLIPLSFTFDVFAKDRAVRERISAFYNFIEDNDRSTIDPVLKFVDLKKGYAGAKIASLPIDQRPAFEACAEKFGPVASVDDGIGAISENLVPMTLRLLESHPRHGSKLKQKFLRCPLYGEFEPIFSAILSYGASNGRLPLPASIP